MPSLRSSEATASILRPVPFFAALLLAVTFAFSATLRAETVLIAGGQTVHVLASPTATSTATATSQAEVYDVAKKKFVPTGSMNSPRSSHTVTTLRNRRVLITGGTNDNPGGVGALDTAEIYDPRIGSFSPTGSMTTPRLYHVATMLRDGSVLITGGEHNDGSVLSSAEVYNPRTGQFTQVGDMESKRWVHTSTLLPNGKVLIAGGCPDGVEELSSAELYNPKTRAFSPTGSMNVPREWHTATLLPNGTVLIAGGAVDANWTPTNTAEIYNPRTGKFSLTAPMNDARMQHTAARIGRYVLIAGGTDRTGPVRTAELFVPGKNIFVPVGSMDTERFLGFAVTLSNGGVLVAGGYHHPGQLNQSAEEFLLRHRVFEPVGDMLIPRACVEAGSSVASHTGSVTNDCD